MTPGDLADAAVAARRRIDPWIRTTPVDLVSLPGEPPVWVKGEHLQTTGSFKARGALAKLTAMRADDLGAGVVAASTGNHGAAVAYAAAQLGCDATVYVPEDAAENKLEAMRRWGARIERVPGDPLLAEQRARLVAAESERTYISPYNDADVIAGQGTVGVELAEQLDAVDTVVVAVGGGGLISGVAAVLERRWPTVHIVGCSPANSNVMMASVAAGSILDQPSSPTLSDGTAGGVEHDTITLALCQELVDEWVAVDEQAIATALRTFVTERHQVIEGSAALALAAQRALSTRRDLGSCVVVSCGANIDPEVLAGILDG